MQCNTVSLDTKIYDSQDKAAFEIVDIFKDDKILNVMLIARTQSGKTGIMIATIKHFIMNWNDFHLMN